MPSFQKSLIVEQFQGNYLKQLKRAKVPTNDLLSFYTTCIRPVAEYACPVFHTALPQYLSDQLERLQKRALRIISNNELSYRQALEVFSIPTLYARREEIGNSMFQDICNNNNHKLHSSFRHLNLALCVHGKIASSKSRVLKPIVSETVLL